MRTIDSHAVRLDQLDDALCALGLGAVVLEVVVVVVQLGALCVLCGQAERNGEVGLANGVEEHALPVGAVLVEGLVDHVPASACALPAASDVLDVVLDDGDQRLVVETAARNPGGQLAVPDQGVAVDLLVVLLCKGNNSITTGKGEVVTGWLGGFPFHGVLRRDRVEVLVDDLGLGRLIADSQSCSKEVAASVTECLVEAGFLGLGAGPVSCQRWSSYCMW